MHVPENGGILSDIAYSQVDYQLSVLDHLYPKNVHLLSNPYLLTILGRLCQKETTQPLFNQYISLLYQSMMQIVINDQFVKSLQTFPTRMIDIQPEGVFTGRYL